MKPTIIYTHTDEAPALATYSFLPILRVFADAIGVDVEKRDISLSGRILQTFSDFLKPDQQVPRDMAFLADLVQKPEANIIKLPNISASLPQLSTAIAELQEQGYAVPDYPMEPKDDREREIRARYD
ncbi:MAG: NADP-dependent isocitrate dehydrogenase, partial [Alkalispirochaeta sp.]